MTWKAMARNAITGVAIVESAQTAIQRPAGRNAEDLCHGSHAVQLQDQEGAFRCDTWFVADTAS